MNNNRKILLAWSGGKDSAWALHVLRQDTQIEVAGLLTTFNREFDRVAMHAVRRELVLAQAQAAGLPLWAVDLPWPCSNQQYEQSMAQAMQRAMETGITAVAFGDLFLEDIRQYRERQLQQVGVQPLFPLWGLDTRQLAREMIASGLRAVLTCIDPKALDRSFAGRDFDAKLLADLPAGVDPCGERGEFHSFVFAGPMFDRTIAVKTGAVVERDGFIFADVLPAADQTCARSTRATSATSFS